jgi:hypothetical protein
VKVAKFKELCAGYWADGRGNVTALHLTEDSFSELYEDILVNRSPVTVVHPHWDLVNPITRELVPVKTCSGPDSVTVQYGGWKKQVKVTIDELQCS